MLSGLKDELCVGICGGCGILIQDRYYLLAADKQWHVSCLRCCECKTQLDSELTCFARNGNIYCKEDYYRLYSIHRCGKCQIGISSRQLVMRVREYVYHLHCFTCTACHKPLNKGDQFGFRDGQIYCRSHYELILLELCPDTSPDFIWGTINTKVSSNSDQEIGSNTEYDKPMALKGRPRKRKCLSTTDHDDITSNNSDLIMNAELSSSMDSFTYDSSSINSPIGSGGSLLSLSLQQQQQQHQQHQQQQQRNKRMRTSFKHHQLRTMKSYFAINQNPDAKDLKQLAQKTGLSKRVLQVWFQNARAKWRRNAMRPESLNTSSNNLSQITTNQSFNNDSPSSNTINLMQAHHHPIQNGQHTELSLIAPYFVNPPYQHSETINVPEHSKFNMTLSAIGSPLPSLTWYLNDNELKPDTNHYEIVSKPELNTTHPTMMSTIYFTYCSINDLGSLQCVAANGIGIATFQVELNVQFKPEVSFIDMDNSDDGAIFIAGESLRIKAKFSGNPRPEICWFFQEDNEYEIITEDGLSILKIEELSRKNRGEYTVEARNHLGLSKCSTLITVVSRPNAPFDLNVEWTYSGVLISWLKSEDDGGSEIVKYTVDYYRKGWDLWLKLIDSNEEAVFVDNLIENSNYKFRVKAENLYGTSDPSTETDWVYVTYSTKNNEEIDNKVRYDTYDFDIDSENTEDDTDTSSHHTDTDLNDVYNISDTLNLNNNNDNGNNNDNSEYQMEIGDNIELMNLRLWNNSVLITVCILILILFNDFYAALTLFILFVYYVVEQCFLQV